VIASFAAGALAGLAVAIGLARAFTLTV